MEDEMKIDQKRVRADLAVRVLWVKEMKRSKRESGQPNWNGEKERSLLGWQVQITLLCMLLAFSRGRLHLRKWGPEKVKDVADQERFVVGLESKYRLQEAA